ncbi:GNAT family N-acetyltransferase [Pantoea sp.]|uniref:GNAT family N-acetyltransferase n=1 Tax=Pantoea sp. TaxID=69393 RepID=UPI0031D53167
MMKLNRECFLVQYEQQIAGLKQRFTIPTTTRWKHEFRKFKRWCQQFQPGEINVADFSSMFAVPTSRLSGKECTLHRVWLGGPPPPNVTQTIVQWQRAIEASQSEFQQTLWVWDAQQLAGDVRFVAQQADDELQPGILFLTDALVNVNSLSALMREFDPALTQMLQQLHDKRYYATLSDFFRMAILTQRGGVYMDADTLPAQPATLFLCQPELPDFSGTQQRINWLNLFTDETGMIISHQQNPALLKMQQQLSDIYRHWPQPLANKTPESERAIFEPFYQLWCEQLTISQLSHQDFSREYAICGFDVPQQRICGIKGMRLQEDILSGEKRALSDEEESYYQHTIAQLNLRNWQIDNPLTLAEFAPLFIDCDILQIAYAPQLRAEIPYYHYYGVLSQDKQLDKVNALFSDFLIANNQQAIDAGDFWQPIFATIEKTLWFKPGTLANCAELRCMAQLILRTSYLEYCSISNLHSLDIISLQQQQNIQPFLSQISMLYNAAGKMIGFINAAPMRDYDSIKVGYGYRAEVRPLDDAYDSFVTYHSQPDDYFVCSVALHAEEQGKGYFSQVLSRITHQAKQQKLRRITLCVWQSSPALVIYRKKGFELIATMEKEVSCFNDKLLFMAITL